MSGARIVVIETATMAVVRIAEGGVSSNGQAGTVEYVATSSVADQTARRADFLAKINAIRAFSRRVNGIVTVAPIQTWPGSETGSAKIVWLTDSHNITTPTALRDSAVTGALATANSWPADALVHTGDIGDNQDVNVLAAFALLRGTAIGCPIYYCIGNHDEYEATPGTPNTTTIAGASYFNRASPFYATWQQSVASGPLLIRIIAADNNYYDVQPSNPSVVNTAHVAGDRVGHSSAEPAGGSYRQFGATQLAWIAATLAADTTSHVVLILMHYPLASDNPTDVKLFLDRLQFDGRPSLILSGHVHSDAALYTQTSTNGLQSFSALKAPGAQERGNYVRLQFHLTSGAIVFDEVSIQNLTPIGGETYTNAPFVVG